MALQQHGLAVARTATEEPLNVVTEANVQHSVGLIEHCEFDFGEREVSAFDVVNHSTRCSDDNGRAAAELVRLRLHRLAAVEANDRQVFFARELLKFLADLQGQFASGSQDQCGRLIWFGIDEFEDRQRERGGFSGSGLGLSEQIKFFQSQGNKCGLNRRRSRVPDLSQSRQGFRRQTQLLKIQNLFSFCYSS